MSRGVAVMLLGLGAVLQIVGVALIGREILYIKRRVQQHSDTPLSLSASGVTRTSGAASVVQPPQFDSSEARRS